METALNTTRPATPVSTRYWEIDTLRGIAVVLMIIFHATWDLHFFGLVTTDVFSGPWQIFARSIGATFLMLLGLSIVLGQQRYPSKTLYRSVRRGGLLFMLGMLVSGATYLAVGDTYVRFGILHLLGVATILVALLAGAPPFLNVIIGCGALASGLVFPALQVPVDWLLWLGITAPWVAMVDYYPVFPWVGFSFLGAAAGHWLYPLGIRRIHMPAWDAVPIASGLRWLGQHSLAIYLIHQPVLLGTLFILGFRPIN